MNRAHTTMHTCLLVAFTLTGLGTMANLQQPSHNRICDAQLAVCLVNAGRMSAIDAASGARADARCDRSYAMCRKTGYWLRFT
jgi:hypothetical protein